MLEAKNVRHFPLLFLLSLLVFVFPSVFGLYKLLERKPLEENAKLGMVYLYQFPRTATTPSQAALNLKVETWLKWAKIPFYRISNQFFLGSHLHGAAPFAFIKYVDNEGNEKSEWFDSSDAIIEGIGAIFGKYKHDEAEKKLRTAIDDKLFKILMLDRSTRNKETGVGGLDWMLKDDGIAAQMMPILVPDKKLKIVKDYIGGYIYQIHLNPDTWKAYFDAYNFSSPEFEGGKYFEHGKCPELPASAYANLCARVKFSFLQEFLEGNFGELQSSLRDHVFTMTEWTEVSDDIRVFIVEELSKIFKSPVKNENGQMFLNPSSSEAKLDELLKLNFVENEKSYESLFGNDDAIFELFQAQIEPLLKKLKSWENFFNFNLIKPPAPVYASIFGILVQFFETPLNIHKLKEYFQPENGKLNKDAKLLKRFVNKVKKSLKLNGNEWKKLTQKPWTLNYEKVDMSNDKFDGPFSVETDELYDIFDDSDDIIVGNIKSKTVIAAVEKIEKSANENDYMTDNKKKMIMHIMAAYLCNLGKGKALEMECAKKHMEKADKHYNRSLYNPLSITKRASGAIVEYNEELLRTKVLEAVGKAKSANATSDLKIGNEL